MEDCRTIDQVSYNTYSSSNGGLQGYLFSVI